MCGEPGEAQHDLGQSHIVCDQLCVAKCGANLNPNGRKGDLLRASMEARKTENQHLERQPY